jgi:hypothetical protein
MRMNRLERWALLVLIWGYAAGCDRPAASPSGPPRAGSLRLAPAELPFAFSQEPMVRPGLPHVSLRLDYAGPKPCLRIDLEEFDHGKLAGESHFAQEIQLPYSGTWAVAFGERKDAEGNLQAALAERLPGTPVMSRGATARGELTVTRSRQAALGSRPVSLYQPAWPLEVPEGQEAVVWGVFVGGSSEKGSPLERAHSAESAWIFKFAATDLPRK